MTLRTGKIRSSGSQSCTGFTLIELILVMALIVIMASMVTPQLGRFFRGRTLDNEARRFLSLTRYGQDRAVAEGIPMVLWIDEQNRRYGLEARPGYLTSNKDSKAVQYDLASDLIIQADNAIQPTHISVDGTTTVFSSPQMTANLRYLQFGTDGFISPQSPSRILIRRDDDPNEMLVLRPSLTWQYYDLVTNNAVAYR